MYLILANRTAALNVTRKLFRLRRPNPDAGDVTLYWVGIIEHADGRAALDLSGAGTARIDPQATDDLIDDIRGTMTAREVSDAKQALRDARGSRKGLSDLLPSKVKERLVLRQAMEADGWFSEEL